MTPPHPWQLWEPTLTGTRDNWLNSIDNDKFILQLQRLKLNPYDNEQYDDVEEKTSDTLTSGNDQLATSASPITREELKERLKNVQAFARLLERVKMIHRNIDPSTSSSIYNPLPYGGPYRDGIRLVEDVEV